MYSSSENLSERQISRIGRSRLSTSTHASANSRGDFVGDQADAVLVRVDQVAGLDFDARDHHGRAEIDQSHVGMADARVQAEELEAEGLDFVQVAWAAAGDVSDAAELLVDRRGDLAELGTQPGGLVEVPADRDLGPGHRGHVRR